MARPSKSVNVIKMEKKAHRTKRELAHRERQEVGMLSGQSLKELPEVKTNPTAHRVFLKLKKILTAIGKNDAIYEASINRYCLITAEAEALTADRERLDEMERDIEDHKADMDYNEYMKGILEVGKQKISIDKELRAKRQQLFSLEKENGMTISAALRIVQKTPETKTSALREALSG